MGYVKTDEQNYYNIADALRAKYGTSQTFYPAQMASAITNIPSGSNKQIQIDLSANNTVILPSLLATIIPISSNDILIFNKEVS